MANITVVHSKKISPRSSYLIHLGWEDRRLNRGYRSEYDTMRHDAQVCYEYGRLMCSNVIAAGLVPVKYRNPLQRNVLPEFMIMQKDCKAQMGYSIAVTGESYPKGTYKIVVHKKKAA